ncbi:MAG: hypothetical protein LBH18_03310 [Spirochaetaceae bacterium]|jgi:glucosamine-6-phosphate deaminase|nr:hypothetical protein [Spirochaetaceae bacterium]
MIDKKELLKWCRVKSADLINHPERRVPLRIVRDSAEMGRLMARELADEIIKANAEKRQCVAVIPCGPRCWYKPFTDLVNAENVSMKNFVGLHMDECLNWEGKLLKEKDPNNFRAYMEIHFYGNVHKELQAPAAQRYYPTPANLEAMHELAMSLPIDITLGGWGQDGHLAFNQARREPYSPITLDELRSSTIRIQNNNWDTVLALAQRGFGGGYQFVAPMSITYGLKECMRAKKVRVYSDTGAWKQTALRVALFSKPDVEYPFTLLQEHPDAVLTATEETTHHPVSENPDWEFDGM